MKEEFCVLKVHINGQHTFFLNQRILCTFSGTMKKMIRQEMKKRGRKCSWLKITDFPGGPSGFELATGFCYNHGRIPMNPSNICLLHCSATFLEMTEEVYPCNLLTQAENFLGGIFYWTWTDILISLKSCEPFISLVDSTSLLQDLISTLLEKISGNPDTPVLAIKPPMAASSPSSSASLSSDTSRFRFFSSTKTPNRIKPNISMEWWFDDLTTLHPKIIEKFLRTLRAYGNENQNLILTRFLLHYLVKKPGAVSGWEKEMGCKLEYGALADTAVYGVVLMGNATFSCRALFWVLKVVSGLGFSRDCRNRLERLMGLMLDQATLDDLLVSGHDDGGVYDVNLVLRLLRVFVSVDKKDVITLQRLKKVGRLIDKYLKEISPDQNLKVFKFVAVAESLPDSARDCFDGLYRALDIYLEVHPRLSFEERGRLCRCLNNEKLTLEACRHIAKNPRIPPGVAVKALATQSAQQPKTTHHQFKADQLVDGNGRRTARSSSRAASVHRKVAESGKRGSAAPMEVLEEKELMQDLQRMQWKVVELEKECREMNGQICQMVKNRFISSSPVHHCSRGGGGGLPRLC